MSKKAGYCPECKKLTVIEDFTNPGKHWCNNCNKYVSYPPLKSQKGVVYTTTVIPDSDDDDTDPIAVVVGNFSDYNDNTTDVDTDDYTPDDFSDSGGDFGGAEVSGDY